MARMALAVAGTNAAAVGFDKLGQVSILYKSLETLGGGASLTCLVLGSLVVFLIERQFAKAAAFALVGAVMTFFGFMHGEHIGFGQSPAVALSYLIVAAVLFGCRYASTSPKPAEIHEHAHGGGPIAEPAR